MGEMTTLRLLVKGSEDIVDGVLSRRDGGAKLDTGVAELIDQRYPDVRVNASFEGSQNFSGVRAEIEAGTTALTDPAIDIAILSIAEDIRMISRGLTNREKAVNAVREDMIAVIESIKVSSGACILIANVSTVDHSDTTFDYSSISEEPFSLRTQRLDLLLLEVSHSHGISIIDTDRLIAELGAGQHVLSAIDYSPVACRRIAEEVVRILEDYGFFDDRPILQQAGVGAA